MTHPTLPDLQPCHPEMPRHLYDSLVAYAADHRPTGGFLRACLRNDLCGAACGADTESLAALPVIVRFIHNELPSRCHGSREAVEAWLKK